MSISAANFRTGSAAAPHEQLSPALQEELSQILENYLADVERGVDVDAEELAARHPELSAALRFYLGGLDFIQQAAAQVSEPPAMSPPHRELGDFRILRELGRGGMGVVYEAQQISMRRKVALKVLPFAAVLDQRQIVRFNNEAQAAGQLNHPHIVPVYSVGCERGVHYYSMQLIDGQPVDLAIRQLRRHDAQAGVAETARRPRTTVELHANRQPAADHALPVEDPPGEEVAGCRLSSMDGVRSRQYVRAVAELGVQAAEGLQHAHEFGIVHRDVKPSNLIIDRRGDVWITDFGLARCQTNASVTMSGDLLGTVGYMSPEQAAGRASLVDHRTDLYSLGITLYELLTLEPAVRGETRQELLHSIEHQDPIPLRRLNPAVPIDLETIVLMATAKLPADRYETAEALANDLRHFLAGEPTLARRPTVFDFATRWAGRHRKLVWSVFAVMFAALLGTSVAALLIAREQQRTAVALTQAREHYRQTRQVVGQFGALFSEQLATVPGTEDVRHAVLTMTLSYYEQFVDDAHDDADLLFDLAFSHSKIGEIRGQLGETDQALDAYLAAMEYYEQLIEQDPAELRYRHDLALCGNNTAHLLEQQGSVPDARRLYLEALAVQRKNLRSRPDDVDYQAALAVTLTNLGSLQRKTGRPREAAAHYREAIGLQEALAAGQPAAEEHAAQLAVSYNELSFLLGAEPPEALDYNRRATETLERLAEGDRNNWRYRLQLAACYNNRGSILTHAGQSGAARQAYEQGIAIQEDLARRAPAALQLQMDLGVSYNNLGQLVSEASPAEAEEQFRLARRVFAKLAAAEPENPRIAASLGGVLNNLGLLLERRGRRGDALPVYEEAIKIQQSALGAAPEVIEYRNFLSTSFVNYGRTLREEKRSDEAAAVALQRRELWGGDGERLYRVAVELALAAAGVRQHDPVSANYWDGETLVTLAAAVEAGFQDAPRLRDNEAFASLASDAEFQTLLVRAQGARGLGGERLREVSVPLQDADQ